MFIKHQKHVVKHIIEKLLIKLYLKNIYQVKTT